MAKKTLVAALVGAFVLSAGAGVAWVLWPEEPVADEPHDTAAGDTGMSVAEQKRLAKEIGYFQQ